MVPSVQFSSVQSLSRVRPITSWQIDEETMETMRDFILGGSKIIANVDCSHEIKRCFLLGIKAYDHLRQHSKKQRHYIANKSPSNQSYGFSVVMYGCESWTIQIAEDQRIDAFELWCWRRLLRVPWTARRSKQSILKEISLEYSLEGLMLKLKLQYFGHLMQELAHWKNPNAGKDWRQEERGWQRTWCLNGITDLMDLSLSKL